MRLEEGPAAYLEVLTTISCKKYNESKGDKDGRGELKTDEE